MKQLLGFIGLLLVSLLDSSSGFTQTIKGTVRDSTGHAVPYATVNLRNKSQDVIISYSTTDTGGVYVLHPPAGAMPNDLYVDVRCIGYLQQSKPLNTIPSVVDFTLAVLVNQLQSVVVHKYGPVLHTNGDTISYKVADFSSAQDRVIGDVIKRLPGISVATDGTISYNNKPISSVYLSGDNLLDDKYTIATNTIPQDIVDQVQVIDNHQPIKVLQNKVASNDVAINLTIKKPAKLRLLGQETVGAGLPGNYDLDLNALLFKDQYKAINYLKGNNTGEDLQLELVSHNATTNQERLGYDPPTTVLSLGAVNNPNLSRQRYFFDRSALLSANNLVNLKNDWQVRINAWYLHDQQPQTYSQQTTTFLPGDTVKYSEIQHNQFNPNLFHTQLSVLLNQQKCYLNDVLLMDDNRWTNYSHLDTNDSLLNQVFKDDPLNFSNEFDWMRSLRSSNIIEAYSYVSHTSEPENRSIGPSYNPELFNHDIPYMQLVQTINVPTWFTNNYISFKIPGNLVTKSFRTGFSVQSQTLTSTLNSMQSNYTLNPISDSSVNDLSWNRKKLYAEAAFSVPGQDRKLKANLVLPLTFQRLNYSDTNYALNKELTRLYFNPQLIGKYQTGPETFVTFQYSYRNQTGSIEDVYHGYILKDYRTLYANNADLTLKQNQQASLGYNYRKALSLFFFSLNVIYNHISANNITSSIITNNFQQAVMLPYHNSTDTRTVNGFISKYSFKLRTTFSSTIQWQNSQSEAIQNGALLPFSTTALTLNLSDETKLSKQLNFSYIVTGTQTYSHSSALTSTSLIDQLVQQAKIYYNPSVYLQFMLAGEHYFTRSQGNPDLEYFFADASGKYQFKKRKISLQLDATNFLNIKTYRAFYLTTNTFTANSYTLPGRIILLKILFNI